MTGAKGDRSQKYQRPGTDSKWRRHANGNTTHHSAGCPVRLKCRPGRLEPETKKPELDQLRLRLLGALFDRSYRVASNQALGVSSYRPRLAGQLRGQHASWNNSPDCLGGPFNRRIANMAVCSRVGARPRRSPRCGLYCCIGPNADGQNLVQQSTSVEIRAWRRTSRYGTFISLMNGG